MAACRAILVECLIFEQDPRAWMPLAEVRHRTRWPADGSFPGAIRMHSAVLAAAKAGLVEFKSGETSGRASVRLKVHEAPAIPAKENP